MEVEVDRSLDAFAQLSRALLEAARAGEGDRPGLGRRHEGARLTGCSRSFLQARDHRGGSFASILWVYCFVHVYPFSLSFLWISASLAGPISWSTRSTASSALLGPPTAWETNPLRPGPDSLSSTPAPSTSHMTCVSRKE